MKITGQFTSSYRSPIRGTTEFLTKCQLQGFYRLKITGIFFSDEESDRSISAGGTYSRISIMAPELQLLTMGTTDQGTQDINHIQIHDKGRYYCFTAPIYIMNQFNGDFYIRFFRRESNRFTVVADQHAFVMNFEAEQVHNAPARPLDLIYTYAFKPPVNPAFNTNVQSGFLRLRPGRYKIRLNGWVHQDGNNTSTTRYALVVPQEPLQGTAHQICAGNNSRISSGGLFRMVRSLPLYHSFTPDEWSVVELTGRNMIFVFRAISTSSGYSDDRLYFDIIAIDGNGGIIDE